MVTHNSTFDQPQLTAVRMKAPSPSTSKAKITADTTSQDVSQLSFDKTKPLHQKSMFIKNLKNYQRGSVRVNLNNTQLQNLVQPVSTFPTEQNETLLQGQGGIKSKKQR